MSKEIVAHIKLTIEAGKANPAPPVGPALGQRGLNIQEFCKAFNAATKNYDPGTPIPVIITAYKDRSFTFETKLPPVSFYLKKTAKIKSGSSATKREKAIAEITLSQCASIASEKLKDLNTTNVQAATKTVIGTARSMGLEVIEGN